jgi:acetyltransferase-like isoleucine patch superfamily enzyme
VVESYGALQLPETTILEPNAVIYIGERGLLRLGERNTIYPNVTIRIDIGEMVTGAEVSFGPGVQIYEPRAGLTIGEYTLIAGGCVICGVSHGSARTNQPMRLQTAEAAPIHIGRNVWVGMGTTIVGGISIGDNTIVGAHSLVNRSLPANVVAFGTPCRVVRQRSGDRAE